MGGLWPIYNRATAMALPPGTRLSPYNITAKIGEGGMGEVYRARDTKLDRDVAIKILPEPLAADPERIARFEREAKTLAALNHPNIAHIHGLEESDGIRGLVMELVEGPTLADRLAKGALPIKEALSIAIQIADGLDAAHEKSIVHRDLKPANIKITSDGQVKLLDFGLAKLAPTNTATADLTQSPTVTVDRTRDGVLLGTAAYMSPEQARGQPVDKRTDIWAFGCVLFEMLTGRAAFRGNSITDTLAAVVDRDPDWDQLATATPQTIRELLQRCLEKDPKRRLRDIGDARLAFEKPGGREDRPPPPAFQSSKLWRIAAAASIVLAAIAVTGWWRATRVVSRAALRFPVDLGTEASDPQWGSGFIISPDGTRVVYRARDAAGTVRLFARTLDANEGTAIRGTEGALAPFFSPDGNSVGFFDGVPGKLKKVSLKDGEVVQLCDAPFQRGGSWGEDGNLVISLQSSGPLSRISAAGGTPQIISTPGRSVTHRWPQVLPGAQAVLFTANDSVGDFDRASIDILSLRTGEQRVLVRGAYYGRYVASGHLLYVRHETLYAAPFDLKRQVVTGAEGVVQSGLRTRVAGGGAALDVSASGILLYAAGVPVKKKLAWLDTTGRFEELPARKSEYTFQLRFAPNGQRLALATAETGNLDVWIYEWPRDTWNRLTSSPGPDSYPAWSPDGGHVAFTTPGTVSGGAIDWKRADGAGDAIRLVDPGVPYVYPSSFSPAGDYLAFYIDDTDTKGDLWLLPLDDTKSDHPRPGGPIPFLKTRFNERSPMISPDGQYVAYQSDESGHNEVYVQPFPRGGAKWPVSVGGGSEPVWSRNGHELFYRGPDGMMVVSFTTSDSTFKADKPRVWAAVRLDLVQWFDLAPDGKRFIVVEDEVEPRGAATPVTFVLNFFDELRRLAPSGKR
jgi:Tol biopolymer transport system component